MSAIQQATDKLKAILCDPEGIVCISGSDGDRREVQEALAALDKMQGQEPIGEVIELPERVGFGRTEVRKCLRADWSKLNVGDKVYASPVVEQAMQQSSDQGSGEVDERALFEAMLKRDYPPWANPLPRFSSVVGYADPRINGMWLGWKAGRAAMTAKVKP